MIVSKACVAAQPVHTEFRAFGDKLLSDRHFLQLLHDTCLEMQGCDIDKVTFDYHKNAFSKTVYEDNDLSLKTKLITNNKKDPDNADKAEKILKLNVYKGGKETDSLDIFETGVYDDILVAERWFYLNDKLELWTLDLTFDFEAIEIFESKKYILDVTSGKFMLINSHKFEGNQNVN